MKYINYLFTIAFLFYYHVEGKVNLTFIVRNYLNPNNVDDRLKKCEAFYLFGDNCDPMFQLTAYTTDAYNVKKLTLKREAGPFANKKSVQDILQATAVERFFPVTIEVDLDIHDHDVDEDQRIARFRRQFPVFETGQVELRLGADVQVEVLVKVSCATDYYGPQCQVYCLPMPGLWNCNQVTGARICDKPCQHGSCVLTNTSAVCVCATGWTGEFCKMPSESSVIESMLLPEMPFNIVPQTGITPTYNMEGSSEMDAIPSHLYLDASTVEINKPADENEVDSLFTYAPIISLGHGNISEFENNSGVAQNLNDSLMAITAVSAGVLNTGQPINLILLITSITVAIWIILMVIGGVVFYRRHGGKGGAIYSGISGKTKPKPDATAFVGSIWTNSSYGITPGTLCKQYVPGYLKAVHEYENTLNSHSQGTRTPSTMSSTLSYTPRSSLPRAPNAYHSPPPVVTGSRIRFAATPVSTLPPDYKSATCRTEGNHGWPANNDQYEELSGDIGDYSIWEQDVSSKTPLTSFQAGKTSTN